MADVAELIVALKLQDGVSSGLGRLNGQLSGMGAGLSQVGRGIGQVGTGLGTIATRGAIAAAAGLTAVVTAAVSFEDAFAGVRKTVDATEGQFGVLEERLREMARTMPVSFEELAGIAEQGGALGIAFEGLDEFTKVVADLAATTDLTADTAATSLGVLGNVLGLSADDFDNFGSALVDLGNKGASTESQILGIAERAGAAGDLIGLSADQVLGFGAAAANMGIEVEAGGTSLQRFFIDALTAVETGGEDLETFARTAGVSADSFRDSFRNDAGAALADFVEGLGKLPEAVQIETLADLGFNDVRITRLLLGLAGDADNLTDSLAISAQAFAENSALGEEAAKRYATTASQIKILKQNVIDAAVVIGDELLPVVGELTSELVTFLNQPETRAAIKDFAESLAGGIREFVAEIRKADFGPLIDTMKGAAEIARGAFDAFRSLPQPIQQLALAALVANKVTGGAVGQIAAGLANILSGSLKVALSLRGSSPANPLWVQSVGGIGGTPGAPVSRGPAGGIGRLALGLTGVGIAALLAEEFSDEIQGLGADIHDSFLSWLPTSGLSARDLEWPFGPKNTPRILPEIFGGNGLLGGAGAFTPPRSGGADPNPQRPRDLPIERELLSTFAKLREGGIPAVLPDTAMAPITAGVAAVDASVRALPPIIATGTESTGRTLRDSFGAAQTAIVGGLSANRADAGAKLLGLSFKADAQLNALALNRADAGAKLLGLSAKYDVTNAQIGGTNYRLDTANVHLANISAKNFTPIVKVDTHISLQEWQRTEASATRARSAMTIL